MIPFKVDQQTNGRGYIKVRLLTLKRNNLIGNITINGALGGQGGAPGYESSIWSLEVKLQYEAQGFGTYLLEEAERIAKDEHKSKVISLYCYSHRLSFYLDRGYVPIRRWDKCKYDMIKVIKESGDV